MIAEKSVDTAENDAEKRYPKWGSNAGVGLLSRYLHG